MANRRGPLARLANLCQQVFIGPLPGGTSLVAYIDGGMGHAISRALYDPSLVVSWHRSSLQAKVAYLGNLMDEP